MQTQIMSKSNINIDLSITLINDMSIYAKRVTTTTLQTSGVIKDAINESSYAEFLINPQSGSLERDYLEKVASLVEQFDQLVDQTLTVETGAIKRKEELSKIKLLRRLLKEWRPMELMTKGWINVLYAWFLYRIDQISKTYLNQLIENIHYKENENEQ